MSPQNEDPESTKERTPGQSSSPERFAVEVCAELPAELVRERCCDLNVLLRLSILSGLQMELESTLNLLLDFAYDIAPYERALVYFWDESKEKPKLSIARHFVEVATEGLKDGNVLNCWATRCGRPLLISQGQDAQADNVLAAARSASALILPLMAGNQPAGTMQLFSSQPAHFSKADAQLLWMLSLIAETQLTREGGHEGLLRFAFTDFLTGLKTRGYFEQQLELEIARSERHRQPFALVMVDIDWFKPLNDRYGHHAGDQVLRDVAALLMKDMRDLDTVARYGGEEFVIILPETTESEAQFVAQRLRRAVEQSRFFAGSPRAVERLTISLGVAMYGADGAFRQQLIENADAALYAAKNQGRNRVVLYSELKKEREREAG